jgi:WD40 repeat protein
MISKDSLLVTGDDKLSILNVNQHNLVRIINIFNSGNICISCILNKNMLLTGDNNHNIKQWRIEGDNLICISTKENAHSSEIYSLLKLGNGHILSGASNGEIKIW